MSSLGKSIILLCVILGIGAGLVIWKNKVGGGHSGEFSSLSKQEVELFFELFFRNNPMALKQLAENPEKSKEQIDNLRELFAIASEAQKDSSVNNKLTRGALEIIDSAVWAQSYDREIHKDQGPMPPFGFIEEPQIKAFYGEDSEGGFWGSAKARVNEAKFQKFLDINLEFMRMNRAASEDLKPSEEELKMLREQFAKIMIYYEEAKAKAQKGELSPDFVAKTELLSKLQRAQFLARQYQKVLEKKSEVTDADIQKYLEEHPEIDKTAEKKALAEQILQRARNGEDFEALAKEFSDDPGSKSKGGLYENVVKGQMMPDFEATALALEPNQIADKLVETPYGFHIIKLLRKGETKDQTGQVTDSYDVRHILISTGVKDPENPMSREMPVKEFVRQKLEVEKSKQVLDDIIARNPVYIAEDFVIPQVTDEEIQKLMEKQKLQMQEMENLKKMESGEKNKNTPKKNEPKKPEDKKK